MYSIKDALMLKAEDQAKPICKIMSTSREVEACVDTKPDIAEVVF
jgi:hypothetical protein